ncbi:MAG: hypothetical protein ABI444_10585 [Candidatus Kapaibacterium sp.]
MPKFNNDQRDYTLTYQWVGGPGLKKSVRIGHSTRRIETQTEPGFNTSRRIASNSTSQDFQFRRPSLRTTIEL